MYVTVRCAVIACGLVLAAGAALAQEAKVEKLGAPAEGTFPASLAAALGPEGVRVVVDGKPVADLWLAKSVPTEKTEKAKLGVAYPELREGTFVGIVRLAARWTDYKAKPVPPGDYTMRYSVLPQDGNHMGVAEHRDFVLLTPVAQDSDPASFPERAKLYDLSRKATGTNHPAVMSLLPPGKDAHSAAIRVADGKIALTTMAGSTPLVLIVQGHSDAEGY